VARDRTGFAYQIAFFDGGTNIIIKVRKRTNGTWSAWTDWTPSSFAPAGYGLGNVLHPSNVVSNPDDAINTGWYGFFNTENTIQGFTLGVLEVISYTSTRNKQIFYSCNSDKVYQRYRYEGEWSAWTDYSPSAFATKNLYSEYYTKTSDEEIDALLKTYIDDTSFSNGARHIRLYVNTKSSVLPANIYFIEICKSSTNYGVITATGYGSSTGPRFYMRMWASGELKEWVNMRDLQSFGVTATKDELNHVSGVTSSIQD